MSQVEQREEGDDVGVEEAAPSSPPAVESNKILILLKATGNAPIMKKTKWSVEHTKSVAWVVSFIRKYIKLQPSESLFLYVNQSFAPSPDQLLKPLYDCFNTDNKLILYYSKSPAWG